MVAVAPSATAAPQAMTKSAKKNYINDKIEENENNPHELWKLLNNQLSGCSQKLKTRLTNINQGGQYSHNRYTRGGKKIQHLLYTNSHYTGEQAAPSLGAIWGRTDPKLLQKTRDPQR